MCSARKFQGGSRVTDIADGKASRGDRRRVVMSAFACEPGRGSEQEVGWRWALEMSRWFDVTVITQTRNRDGIEERLKDGIPSECHLHLEYVQLPKPIYQLKSRFDSLTWPYYAVWQKFAFQRASSLHREKPFDLAHHVTFVSFRVPIYLKRLGLPVVFGPVGGADKAPFHLLMRGFSLRICLKELARNCLTDASAVVMRCYLPLSEGKGICLAATPAMGQIFEEASLPYEVFPAIGIDVGREPDPRPSGPLRFLYVGRFHALKGVHLLLEAFAKANVPGASLTLIGSGSEEPKLHQLADQLGITERLTWTGKIPRSQLSARYRNHDVLVAPSLYESGGLVVLEAMAEGLPVIVLDVGGHSISVAEGCGIKVCPASIIPKVIDGLATAMRFYVDHPERIENDGRRARQRVLEHYGWTRKVIHMRGIYRRLIGET